MYELTDRRALVARCARANGEVNRSRYAFLGKLAHVAFRAIISRHCTSLEKTNPTPILAGLGSCSEFIKSGPSMDYGEQVPYP